jgi:hypothetical protein
VLKPGGIIRIAVPDLEVIIRLYLEKLENGNEADYDWMMLELYDQEVRNRSGGEMLNYFKQDEIPNLDFVLSRIGFEGLGMIKSIQDQRTSSVLIKPPKKSWGRIISGFIRKKKAESAEHQIGKFRAERRGSSMDVRPFSLSRILVNTGIYKSNGQLRP